MEQEGIDGVARDDLRLVAMRVGNLERRMLQHRDLIGALVLLVGVLTIALLVRW